jgi:signal transduction histidine kinase
MIAWLLALAAFAGAIDKGRDALVPPAPLGSISAPLAAASPAPLPNAAALAPGTQLLLPFVANLQTLPAVPSGGAAASGPAAASAAAVPPTAPSPAEVLAHLKQNWTLGSEWEAPQTSDPQALKLIETLQDAVRMANDTHRESVDSMLMTVDGMAHDVRNSMSATPMALAIIERSPTPTALDILRRAHSTAKTTISSYVQLARVGAGRLTKARAPVEVAEMMDNLSKNAAPLAAQKQITLELAVEPGTKVLADHNMLEVVLANLLGNAIKYTPKGGRVTLKAVPDLDLPGQIRISVKDTGVGITAEDQAKVFRGHRTEAGKKLAGGTGFGLQLVRKLVEAQGSAIELASQPGMGSTLSFLLPGVQP